MKRIVIFTILLFLLSACSTKPQNLHYDSCTNYWIYDDRGCLAQIDIPLEKINTFKLALKIIKLNEKLLEIFEENSTGKEKIVIISTNLYQKRKKFKMVVFNFKDENGDNLISFKFNKERYEKGNRYGGWSSIPQEVFNYVYGS
jgi:hypothetical protein